ncbi:MAG: hypothetical protein II967_06185, partial [Deltaproteobacteria bacterium]|nr:hypothetical protein [Deltaproteobacteria bacterium]
MSIPIPNTQRELLEHGRSGNAALFFSRMTEYEKEGEKVVKDAVVKLGEEMGKRFPASDSVLKSIHSRQTGILGTAAKHAGTTGNGLALEIRAQLTAPFVSGLGSGHPTETGLVLDRNSGLPCIPASSIKGVLRLACALHIAETAPET